MTLARLQPFIPRVVNSQGEDTPLVEGCLMPKDDLFGNSNVLIGHLVGRSAGLARISGAVEGDHAAFVVHPGLVLSVDIRAVRPSHVQCLLVFLQRNGAKGPSRDDASLQYHILDADSGLGLWTDDDRVVQSAGNAWSEIKSAGEVDRATSLTTPWVYGNKLRLTGFIAPVAAVSLPAGTPVLDLMSGTGIVARALSGRHPMAVNDANAYAALLSNVQGIDPSGLELQTVVDALREPFVENQGRLQALIGARLQEESALLHSEIDQDALHRFRLLQGANILPVTTGDDKIARLATERYANVYFGIAQCVEIDSLRRAIDSRYPNQGRERDLCLAALLVACANGTSGPHFAQPAQPKSPQSLQKIVELRARSIAWEFELALGRLIARGAPRHPFLASTHEDWRKALSDFADQHAGTQAAVYVDPPYSKLQYSRFYHVLNVLLAYDYPSVSGRGRYPPLQQRFSSRFEYQPGVARRELSDLIRTCAARSLSLLLSYGEGGFVSIDYLKSEMGAVFAGVTAFSEPLRHHSQGRKLLSSRGFVLEHLLVGSPG